MRKRDKKLETKERNTVARKVTAHDQLLAEAVEADTILTDIAVEKQGTII